MSSINREFKKDLENSGITTESARNAGIYCCSGSGLKEFGFTSYLDSSETFLVFPYFDPFGAPLTWTREGETFPFARVKLPKSLAKKGFKYLSPQGAPVLPYLPPHCQKKYQQQLGESEMGDIAHGSRDTVFLVEGEKKAIALAQLKKTVIGLGGVWNWKNGPTKLADWIFELTISARKVKILFDGDIWTNPKVSQALRKLGVALGESFVSALESGSSRACCVPQKEDNFLPVEDPPTDELEIYGWACKQIGYSLLPIHPSKKLGIDDLIEASPKNYSYVLNWCLDTWLPLLDVRGGEEPTLYALNPLKLWRSRNSLPTEYLITGDKKKSRKRIKGVQWNEDDAKNLLAKLISYTAHFMGWKRNGDKYYLYTPRRVFETQTAITAGAVADQICQLYRQPNVRNGLDQASKDALAHCPSSDAPTGSRWVGLHDFDYDLETGAVAPISIEHDVVNRCRTRWNDPQIRGYLEPNIFILELKRLFGEDLVEVFRALIRLTFYPPSKRRGVIVNIHGASGTGKSALFTVISKVFPGVYFDRLESSVAAQNAMSGFLPIEWLGKPMVIDSDCKSRLGSQSIAVLNKIAHGEECSYRTMGRQAINQPSSQTVWLISNEPVSVSARDSEGFERRIVPIHVIADPIKKIESNWLDRYTEDEKERVLRWVFELEASTAIATLDEYLDSDRGRRQKQGYWLASNNSLVEWLRTNKLAIEEGEVETTEVQLIHPLIAQSGLPEGEALEFWVLKASAYRSYKSFLVEEGGKPLSGLNFGTAIEKLGGEVPKGDNGVIKTTRQYAMKNGRPFKKQGRFIRLPSEYIPLPFLKN